MFPMYIPNYKKKEKFSHLNPPPTNIDPQTHRHTQKQQQPPFPQRSVRAEREGEKRKKKKSKFLFKIFKSQGEEEVTSYI